jgi:hypothetical protein
LDRAKIWLKILNALAYLAGSSDEHRPTDTTDESEGVLVNSLSSGPQLDSAERQAKSFDIGNLK